MRAVVTAGMVTGLEMLALRDVFDVVYGSSGGSGNGAFFLAGQAAYGTTIYYDRINNDRFIDVFRPLKRRRPVVDLHYVFDTVMTQLVVLDWEAVVQSPIPLKVLATSVDESRTHVIERFEYQQDLMDSLHACARLPLLAGSNPFWFRGTEYWDSGILEPFAIRAALQDEATHVLVLRSTPRGLPRRMNWLELTIIAAHIARRSPVLAERFKKRFDPSVCGLAELERSEQMPDSAPYLFSIMVPTGHKKIPTLETRRDKLLMGAIAGVEATLNTFGHSGFGVVEMLSAADSFGRPISTDHNM